MMGRAKVRIIGIFDEQTGLGAHGLAFLRTLLGHPGLDLETVITSGHADLGSLKNSFPQVKAVTRYSDKSKAPVDFAILCDPPTHCSGDTYDTVANAKIRISYLVVESTRLPSSWVDILNEHFDIVLVASDFVKRVALESGVSTDVIILPLAVDYKTDMRVEPNENKPITYGMIGGTLKDRKNIELLVDVFHRAFAGEQVRLRLRLMCRSGGRGELLRFVDKHSSDKVRITLGPLNKDEYVSLLNEIDCFVSLAMGEGFSVIPREFMMLGKPVVLNDFGAHSDIPSMEGIYFIPASIAYPAHYPHTDGNYYGIWMSPYSEDAVRVLKRLAPELSKRKRYEAPRAYARGFTTNALRVRYRSVFRPKVIERSPHPAVEEGLLRLSNGNVISKYQKIFGSGIKIRQRDKRTDAGGSVVKRSNRRLVDFKVDEEYLKGKLAFLEKHAARLADARPRINNTQHAKRPVSMLSAVKSALPPSVAVPLRYLHAYTRLIKARIRL